MNAPIKPTVDEITARLRAEDVRLRRRMLWLSLLPVAVGVAVVSVAWWDVDQARRERDRLAADIVAHQAEIEGLTGQRAALDRAISTSRDLLDHYAARLPAPEREQVQQLRQGLAEAQRGDAAGAIRAYESAIASDEHNPLPFRLRGEALYEQGSYALADQSLRQAIRLDPRDAQARYALGLTLWQLGRPDEAIGEIERAFADPEVKARAMQDPAFWPIRGVIDASAGQASGGSAEETASIDKGLQAARRGDFGGAIAAYDKALAVNPKNALVLNWRGYALLRRQSYPEAIASLEHAVASDPALAEAHYNLALALWRGGRRNEAPAALAHAYEADSTFRAVAERDPQSRELRAAVRMH